MTPEEALAQLDDGDAQERAARVLWARMAEPYDELAIALIQQHTTTDLVRWSAVRGRTPGGIDLGRFRGRLQRASPLDEQHLCEALGARVVVPGDAEWPAGLDDLVHPPWCLWVRGPLRLDTLGPRTVAVVGSRAATAYGEQMTYQLVGGLVRDGFAIISGAALGIDACAHQATLAGGGRTVAVLAGGVDVAYPRTNAALLARIASTGAVVSETPPGGAPARMRFVARNRIIAALAAGTLLVEAGLRSGARTTVAHARAMERHVAAVPGSVQSAMSAGCHLEIRNGAILVTDAAEVRDVVGMLGADAAEHKSGASRAEDQLGVDEKRVWQWLRPRASASVDDLCDRSGLTVGEVLVALDELDRRGMAQQLIDGWIRIEGGR